MRCEYNVISGNTNPSCKIFAMEIQYLTTYPGMPVFATYQVATLKAFFFHFRNYLMPPPGASAGSRSPPIRRRSPIAPDTSPMEIPSPSDEFLTQVVALALVEAPFTDDSLIKTWYGLSYVMFLSKLYCLL